MSRGLLAAAVGLGVVAAATACSEAESSGTDRRLDVLEELAVDFAAAEYQAFADQSAALSTATRTVCETPTRETLQAARDAWLAARKPWRRAEIVRFGPVVEYPDRLGPPLDDWPVNADAVEDLVAGEGALDQEAFDNMGSATRGLPVLEYLLWGDDALGALSASERRCGVLSGAAGDVQANAGRLVEAWARDYVTPLADASGVYRMRQRVLGEWVNRLSFTVENIRTMKLGKPLGDKAGGTPQPDSIESRLSGRSLQDARDALDGARAVWSGAGEPPAGVRSLLGDPDLAGRIDAAIERSAERLAAIPEPLETAIESSRDAVVAAQDALQELQVLCQVELAQALGITITFNDNDGD